MLLDDGSRYVKPDMVFEGGEVRQTSFVSIIRYPIANRLLGFRSGRLDKFAESDKFVADFLRLFGDIAGYIFYLFHGFHCLYGLIQSTDGTVPSNKATAR